MSQTMYEKLAQEKTRLKALCGTLVERAEPIAIIHMMQFSIMALRCEFTTFMAMSSEKKFMEENEYFKRLIDQIMYEVKNLEKTLDVVVDQNGRVHKKGTPKLLRPGSAGLPN